MPDLPGYDDWLDNHGNPGIWEDNYMYPRWAIEEEIDVSQISENPDKYMIDRVTGPGRIIVSFSTPSNDPDKVDERRLLIDGKDIDLGDDFIAFISILDDFHEDDVPPNTPVRQKPFQDEE